jgi:hypothetical protein
VHELIRVELPDVESATSLTQELFGRFRVELVKRDGSWQVEVPQTASPVRTTPQVLHAVEQWLDLYGLDEVIVHLDGKTHRLQRSAARL